MAAPDSRPLLPHEARALLLRRLAPLPAETVALSSALTGRVVADDVHAAHDLPPFDNSAMDGYAVRAAEAAEELPVRGNSFAGDDPARLEPHTAMTIATGAPLPAGADAVVPVELAHANGDRVSFDGPVALGDHVRPRGTDVPAGAVVISAGSSLRPLALAAIATSGVARAALPPHSARVRRGHGRRARRARRALAARADPRVEQHPHRRALRAGRCAQSSRSSGCTTMPPPRARRSARRSSEADVVVTSGGVSVGTRDHVKPALAALGVEQLFWRLAVQPGRPTWCGLRAGRVVIGLPGNPLSVMVGLELLLVPALRRLAGAAHPGPVTFQLPLTEPLRQDPQRLRVRPVRLVADGAEPLGADLSHQLGRAAAADALALVPAGDGELAAGTPVDLIGL